MATTEPQITIKRRPTKIEGYDGSIGALAYEVSQLDFGTIKDFTRELAKQLHISAAGVGYQSASAPDSGLREVWLTLEEASGSIEEGASILAEVERLIKNFPTND